MRREITTGTVDGTGTSAAINSKKVRTYMYFADEDDMCGHYLY